MVTLSSKSGGGIPNGPQVDQVLATAGRASNPTIVSWPKPAAKTKVSEPVRPDSRSSPAPPVRRSTPAPPKSRSSPEPAPEPVPAPASRQPVVAPVPAQMIVARAVGQPVVPQPASSLSCPGRPRARRGRCPPTAGRPRRRRGAGRRRRGRSRVSSPPRPKIWSAKRGAGQLARPGACPAAPGRRPVPPRRRRDRGRRRAARRAGRSPGPPPGPRPPSAGLNDVGVQGDRLGRAAVVGQPARQHPARDHHRRSNTCLALCRRSSDMPEKTSWPTMLPPVRTKSRADDLVSTSRAALPSTMLFVSRPDRGSVGQSSVRSRRPIPRVLLPLTVLFLTVTSPEIPPPRCSRCCCRSPCCW